VKALLEFLLVGFEGVILPVGDVILEPHPCCIWGFCVKTLSAY